MSAQEKDLESNSSYAEAVKGPTTLLKFVNEKASCRRPEGKKCHPKQLFGVSSESPNHFQRKNTLIADYGYRYKQDDNP